MFSGKRKKFYKLYTVVHVFGEGIEIPEISYDCPCFWRRERNSKN